MSYYDLPISQDEMSFEAHQLLRRTKADFIANVNGKLGRNKLDYWDFTFFALSQDAQGKIIVITNSAAYAYFEMRADLKYDIRFTSPEISTDKSYLALYEAKQKEMMEAYKANPNEAPLKDLFVLQNGEVTALGRIPSAFIRAFVLWELKRLFLSMSKRVKITI